MLKNSTDEYREKLQERQEVVQALATATARLTALGAEIRGKRLPHHRYLLVLQQQADTKVEVQRLNAKAAEIKTWMRLNCHQAERRIPQPEKGLDEYDLGNALSEPRMLIAESHKAIKRLTRAFGMTEADRGLVDALEDYMRRHAMML